MKKSITSLLRGWCAGVLCSCLALPSFAAADAGAAFAAQRHDLKLSFRSAPLREVVTAFTRQTGVVFSYETSLGERTMTDVDVALNGSTLDEMLASVFAGSGISYKIKDKVVCPVGIRRGLPGTCCQTHVAAETYRRGPCHR